MLHAFTISSHDCSDPDDHNDPDDKCDPDDEQEVRELEEQAQRFREQRAMRLRCKARRINDEILESLNY